MTTAVDAISTPLLIAGRGTSRRGAAPSPSTTRRTPGAVIGHAAAASARRRRSTRWRPPKRPGPPGPRCPPPSAPRIVPARRSRDSTTDADERAEILSRENGKIRFEADDRPHRVRRPVPPGGRSTRPNSTTTSTSRARRSTRRSPSCPGGVVTIIYPFNWPLAILAASPARRADGRQHGDREAAAHDAAVVGADAPAPGRRALPPGVLNVVTGADEVVGPVVVGDPRIRHVCFTGSVGGGKRIMAMAAANLTNVTLELGGNDPAVVLDDAVLDEAAFAKMSGATFMTTGQVCMALKRLYVPRSRYDEVVDGLRADPGRTRRSAPASTRTSRWARSTRASQRDYVAELLEEARGGGRRGARRSASTPATGRRATTCGRRSSSTRRRTLRHRDRGAVRPGAADHPLRQRGGGDPRWPTTPGPGCARRSGPATTSTRMRIARQLRTGVTFFNNHNATAVDERAPFGGFNQSGIGRELGREGRTSRRPRPVRGRRALGARSTCVI